MTALIVVGVIAIALAVTSIFLTRQVSRFRLEAEATRGAAHAALQEAQSQINQLRGQLNLLQANNGGSEARIAELTTSIATLEDKARQNAGWIEQAEVDIEWYRAELEKRPKIVRKTYKILTLGISGTGKTALTLKWANPLTDLGALQGTKIERYERTVSHVEAKDVTIEHVFEVGDWGGEHIVDAQQELVVEEIHGLLMVVDLATKDAKAVDPSRIQQQLREFQPESLKFFFGPKTIASCKTVVLFINKADVIAGTPSDVEREARALYKRLIDDLEKFKVHLDVRVLVGSATYGHSTHHLFSHFVERILPKNAYDTQLLQRMKSDAAAADMAASSFAPPLQATQPLGHGPALPNTGHVPPPPARGGFPSGGAAPAAATAVPPVGGSPRPGGGTVPNLAGIRRPDGKR